MKPKFEIGDWVEVEFESSIEGVKVAIRKRLVVTGILLAQRDSTVPLHYEVYPIYHLAEEFPGRIKKPGRTYERREQFLIPIEPMINEMKKAQAQQS